MNAMLGATKWLSNSKTKGKSEAWSQQVTRINVSKQGAYSWRNNVGAIPTKCSCGAVLACPACGKKPRTYRHGLANDSAKLNAKFKSSDLILGIPRRITQIMVGRLMLQLGAVETKPPGWEFTGTEREIGQLNWLTLIQQLGGYATFSTGEVDLND